MMTKKEIQQQADRIQNFMVKTFEKRCQEGQNPHSVVQRLLLVVGDIPDEVAIEVRLRFKAISRIGKLHAEGEIDDDTQEDMVKKILERLND